MSPLPLTKMLSIGRQLPDAQQKGCWLTDGLLQLLMSGMTRSPAGGKAALPVHSAAVMLVQPAGRA